MLLILEIVLLVLGIMAFVKRRVNVSATRELRGPPVFLVGALFCLPLPLAFAIGAVIGARAVANGKSIDRMDLVYVELACVGVPVVLGLLIGFAMSKPKLPPAPPPLGPQGFDVKM
jgi:hypothetical protein